MTDVPETPAPRGRLRRGLVILGFVVAAAAGVAGEVLFLSLQDLPDIDDLAHVTPTAGTKLYDNGDPPEMISQLAIEQRTFVPLARMPRALLDAIVSIEDERFYSHWGLDVWGIFRAAIANLTTGKRGQGASTLTQQLARTLFLTREKTIERKIKEAILAVKLERRYKKDEILEMYLNQIYFGQGAWGVEQAGRIYFGKHVEQLTLPECALLAGLPKSPNEFSPRRDLEKARVRRNTVLQRMVQTGRAERAEAEEAMNSPVQLRQTEVTNAPYFAAHVRKYLEEAYGDQAVGRGGLSVYTTLNLRFQTIAQGALEQGLAAAETLVAASRRGGASSSLRLQGALVAMDTRTGAILAMIGGRSFRENEFNRATQARRQPGSSFKPIIYTTALLNGYTPSDLVDDTATSFPGRDGKPWIPANFDRKSMGVIPLRRALALSRNVVTARLLNQVGVRTVIGVAKKFGYLGPFRDDLTLAMGTSEVSLLEMVSAFSVFANGGVRAIPYAIRLVKDSQGTILEQQQAELVPVLSPQISYLMLSMLQEVIDRGTGHLVRKHGFARPCAGKTGSTNDYTDAWFIGFTPSMVCGIWLGYDDRRTLGRMMTGGVICAPVWASFMSEALEDTPVENFVRPTGIVTAMIDPGSSLLATKACKRVKTEVFLDGSAPTRTCDREGRPEDFVNQELTYIEATQSPTGEPVEGAPATGSPDSTEGQEEGF